MGFGGNEMIKTSLKKSLVCGIVVLFVSMSITPIAGSLSVEKHSSMIGSIKELNNLLKTGTRGINVTLHGKMGNNGWYVGPVSIEVTADNGSEVIGIQYRLDGGAWINYTAPFEITTDGHHHLEVKVLDQYGNEWYFSFDFKIDMTSPMVMLNKETFKNKIIFTAPVMDNLSGIDRVEFYFNGVLQTNITAPGPYVWTLQPIPHYGHVKVIAYDCAGNNASSSVSIKTVLTESQQSTPQSNPSPNQQSSPNVQQNAQLLQKLIVRQQTMLSIEKEPSVATNCYLDDDCYPVFNGTMGLNGWYVSPVKVSFVYNPEIVRTIFYRIIYYEQWLQYTEPFIIKEGYVELEWYYIDFSGEKHYGSYYPIKIDYTPPMVVCQAERGFDKIVYTAIPFDNMSGIDRVEFYFNGALQHTAYAPGPYTWTLTPIPHIQGNVYVRTYDMAGNSVQVPVFTCFNQNQLNNQQNSQSNPFPQYQQSNQLFHNLIYNLMLRHQMIS